MKIVLALALLPAASAIVGEARHGVRTQPPKELTQSACYARATRARAGRSPIRHRRDNAPLGTLLKYARLPTYPKERAVAQARRAKIRQRRSGRSTRSRRPASSGAATPRRRARTTSSTRRFGMTTSRTRLPGATSTASTTSRCRGTSTSPSTAGAAGPTAPCRRWPIVLK